MIRDEFKVEFKRLCDGFDYQPRPGQIDAFYERLQHCKREDWHEAVTDLLCAPKFPFNLNAIMEVIEVKAEQRRRQAVNRERYQADQICEQYATGQVRGMREACAERPELLSIIQRIMGK